MLTMGMYATSRISQFKCVPEQWCTGRLLQVQFWSAVEDAVCVWRGLWIRKDEHVCGLDALFLHTRWSDVDDVPVLLNEINIAT